MESTWKVTAGCRQRRSAVLALVAILIAIVPAAVADDPKITEADKALQGKWVRRQNAEHGLVTIVKEHKGNSTTLTAYDPQGNVVYAHESEFKVEHSGKFRIFTFFNRKITAGPNAGRWIKEPVSFVYRVENDRFVEVYGVMEGDNNPPAMLIWERMKNQTEPGRAA